MFSTDIRLALLWLLSEPKIFIDSVDRVTLEIRLHSNMYFVFFRGDIPDNIPGGGQGQLVVSDH